MVLLFLSWLRNYRSDVLICTHWHQDERHLNENRKPGCARKNIEPESPHFFHVVQFAAILRDLDFPPEEAEDIKGLESSSFWHGGFFSSS